jgi:hypothetical protein
MNILHHPAVGRLAASAEPTRKEKPTVFEILSGLMLPLILGILATFQPERARFWGFLLLAFFTVAVGLYKPIVAAGRQALKARANRQLVRKRYPELVHLVNRFGELLDPQRITFEDIVRRDLCENSSTSLEQMGIARERIFHDVWAQLHNRVKTTKPSAQFFMQSVRELQNLMNNYVSYCLEPVFERMPVERSNSLRPHTRAELEAFRERFLSTRDRFEDLTREILGSMGAAHDREYYIARPKPLVHPDPRAGGH